jgi:SAM-dependent methyltransferase
MVVPGSNRGEVLITRLGQLLARWPWLYRLGAKVYFGLKPERMRERVKGTRAREEFWAKRKIGAGYWENADHPSKHFLTEHIAAYAPFEAILEVGCASGPNLQLLARRFPEVEIAGIDINPEAIEYGSRRFAEEGIDNVKLITGRADDTGLFRDRSFDIVFTNALLIYIGPDKIEQVIADMLRLSRKALVLLELQDDTLSGESARRGVSLEDNWVRDYRALLGSLVAPERITVNRLPAGVWPVKPWNERGAIIEVNLE